MNAALDALATELYVTVDDLLTRGLDRPGGGILPSTDYRCSDAIITSSRLLASGRRPARECAAGWSTVPMWPSGTPPHRYAFGSGDGARAPGVRSIRRVCG